MTMFHAIPNATLVKATMFVDASYRDDVDERTVYIAVPNDASDLDVVIKNFIEAAKRDDRIIDVSFTKIEAMDDVYLLGIPKDAK